MKQSVLVNKIKESLIAVLPVSIVILVLMPFVGVQSKDVLNFFIGIVFLVIGLALFQIGSIASMVSIAEDIGIFIIRKRNIVIFVLVAFVVGFMITVAEPALWVLADQFKSVISQPVLILSVSLGVGIFVIIALMRILFQFKLRTLFLISYGILFIIALIVSRIRPEFVPIAFDSGGVTTGPMAVPFIMSLGFGISHARGDKASDQDSFGLIGIASIGPIMSVLILGLFVTPSIPISDTSTTFIGYLIMNLIQMAIAILPFIGFFFVFQLVAFKFSKKKVYKILIAFGYTYFGLVLFLTGANAGFVNIGTYIGRYFGQEAMWLLIPMGMVFGLLVVPAEPSVIALNRQVEEISAGAISSRFMMIALSIGVSLAIGLALLRVVTGLSIWWILLPGYVITILLTFITPSIFSSIAFDSGGAVSGAMTSAFLMPFALGASDVIESSNVLLDAFGLVAFVAMAPLITIQVLGLIASRKRKRIISAETDDEIIELKG
ncbi:MAG: DUF1538 domain-containing protein [Acholeplasma sp.]|nr:DUF1538 domain-containing protein [Acholeplasma sp.]